MAEPKDPGIVKADLSSSSPAFIRGLADAIAALDRWQVLRRDEPAAGGRARVILAVRERDEPGE
jgi:hypothetical protein